MKCKYQAGTESLLLLRVWVWTEGHHRRHLFNQEEVIGMIIVIISWFTTRMPTVQGCGYTLSMILVHTCCVELFGRKRQRFFSYVGELRIIMLRHLGVRGGRDV